MQSSLRRKKSRRMRRARGLIYKIPFSRPSLPLHCTQYRVQFEERCRRSRSVTVRPHRRRRNNNPSLLSSLPKPLLQRHPPDDDQRPHRLPKTKPLLLTTTQVMMISPIRTDEMVDVPVHPLRSELWSRMRISIPTMMQTRTSLHLLPKG